MVDILTPLSTWLVEDPDHDAVDTDREVRALWERQSMVDRLLAGEVTHEDLLDLISSQGHNPDEYIVSACAAIDQVLEGRVEIENPEDIHIFMPWE